MTQRTLFRLAMAINLVCWAYVLLNLNIEEECNPVDKSCTNVRYALGEVTLWEAPGRKAP